MTRLAILTDIHGNLEALEAVLADLEGAGCEAVACLGDFIGYGASPNECIDRVRPVLTAAVLGNHDVAALGRLKLGGFHSDAATAARWTSEQLNDANRTWLESLPYSVDWHGVRLVHATPSEPEAWNYVLSISDAVFEWEFFEERICLIGHSHVPGVFVQNGSSTQYLRQQAVSLDASCRYIVNVGSCGQPRDGDPRAAYLILDED